MLLFRHSRTAKENMLHNKMKDDCFVMKVACLADFFSEVNSLNISQQENMEIWHTAHDKVAAFKSKIQLYHRRVQSMIQLCFLR